jgi:hypothetical protein
VGSGGAGPPAALASLDIPPGCLARPPRARPRRAPSSARAEGSTGCEASARREGPAHAPVLPCFQAFVVFAAPRPPAPRRVGLTGYRARYPSHVARARAAPRAAGSCGRCAGAADGKTARRSRRRSPRALRGADAGCSTSQVPTHRSPRAARVPPGKTSPPRRPGLPGREHAPRPGARRAAPRPRGPAGRHAVLQTAT